MNVAHPQRRRFPSLGLILAAAFGALSVGGCSRAHLTPTHGRAYRKAFAVQTANPDLKIGSRSVNGLDSQEASIIAGNYRRALSPKADSAGGSNQLLMVAPQRAVNDSSGLPSSVPGGN
jgi:hypothetical protein